MITIVEGVDGARQARGAVVVVDVMRAFTTAAYAFAAGLVEIDLVETVDEALALPGYRMGEVGGRLIPGFDHNNSPSQLAGRRLDGRRGVLRTGSGTRCVTAAVNAAEIWLGSLDHQRSRQTLQEWETGDEHLPNRQQTSVETGRGVSDGPRC